MKLKNLTEEIRRMKNIFAVGLSVAAIIMLATSVSMAQKGPGGVSEETVGNSTCKLWYDAGTLNYADGTFVDTLNDISLSASNNFATQDTAGYRPMFRNDPSAGINGEPVLIFGTPSASYLKLENSFDVNLATPTNEKTLFIAFRTGSDVWNQQVVYEQGGNVRGINVTISQNYIYLNVYDQRSDPDGTPLYGPVVVSERIYPNTSNVITLRYHGPDGDLSGFIEGHLNGDAFPTVGTGVGSIWEHPGFPGLGAVHGQIIMPNGTITGDSTGAFFFKGSIAELVSYSDTLNVAQRIIVENYLDAKYGVGGTATDHYSYENTYGKRVFGIGKQNNQLHNTSQGAGIFEISGNTVNFQDGEFLLIGDNNAALTESLVNIPNSSNNTKRVAREWRVDHTGNMGDVTIRVEASKLPALGGGFTKYVLIKDNKAGLTSKFAGSNVETIELVDEGNGYYSTTTSLNDGSFLTFGLVKPSVSFVAATDYSFEENANTSASAFVQLNYQPATTVNFNYSFVAGSALATNDFLGTDGLVTFNPGVKTATINFDIVGDYIGESSESFNIQLSSGAGSTPGVDVGALSILEYSIYDNDNMPEVSFATDQASISEDADSVLVDIVRSGNASVPFTVNCRLRTSGAGAGSATNGNDYIFTTPVNVSFTSGEVLKQVVIYLNDDNTDEDDESVFLELYGVSGSVDLVTPVEFELTIQDDDVPPVIQFLDANYFAPESFGEPDIYAVLSAPSDRDIQVEYSVSGGTATASADFSLPSPGTLIIPAGDTIARIPLYTQQDGVPEPDETVILTLANNASLVNATLGAQATHTFTIKDYNAFEWLGPAGVGQISELPLWVNAEYQAGTHNQAITNMNNLSSQAIFITKEYDAALLQSSSNLVRGRANYQFNGAEGYKLTQSSNLNGTATDRNYWLAIKTGPSVGGRQVVYDQGGSWRGLNIYVYNGLLYFHVYNEADDAGPGTEFGPNFGGAVYLTTPIAANTEYLIYAKYNVNATNSLELYLNGNLVASMPATTFSGVVYNHNWSGIGAVSGDILFHDGLITTYPHHFTGQVAEIIAYQNSPITTTRENLINNYLTAKYAMATPSSFHTISSIADDFGSDLAGIGSDGAGTEHSDAQGSSCVRINTASSLDAGDYLLWHNNDAAISDSVTSDLPMGFSSRLARTFQVEEEGEVGTVKLSIDLTGFTIAPYVLDDIELLISNDPNDFSSASRHISGRSMAGNTVTFTGVNLNEGQYFTIAFAPNDCAEGLWTGAAGNDWNNPSNWDCNEVPTDITNVVIPAGVTNFPILDAGITYPAADVTIAAGANITNTVIAGIKPTIEIYGNWNNEGSINGQFKADFVGATAQTIDGDNSFAVLSIDNANGVSVASGEQDITEELELVEGTLITNAAVTLKSGTFRTAFINDFESGNYGDISGDITIERYINSAASGFHYIGFPVNGATVDQLTDDITITTYNGAGNGSQVTPNGSCSLTQLAAGSAYGNVFDYRENTVASCELSGWHVRTSGAIGSAQGLAMDVAAGVTLDQTGTYTTGNINSIPLTYTGSNTSGKIGRNLVANPYQSDINWGDVAISGSNSNITGEAFVFVSSGAFQGTFTTYNLANNANLAPGQAFFVINTTNGSTLDFDNSMRRASAGTFYRNRAQFERKIELIVQGNGASDITTVLFDSTFTTGFDRLYDGRKLRGANGMFTLYTLTDTATGIQSLNALPSDGSVTSVPVGFAVGTTGSYTITANLVTGFIGTEIVLLEDLQTGEIHNLHGGDYSFAADVNDDEMRFVLHFVPKANLSSLPVGCDGTGSNITIDMGTFTINSAPVLWDTISVSAADGTTEIVSNVSGVAYQANDVDAGTYTVEFIYGSYSTTEVIEVGSLDRVIADADLSATEVTVGEPIYLTDLTTGATNIVWDMGDGSTLPNVNNFSHSYLGEGEYTITLSASNTECTDEVDYIVTVSKQVTGIDDNKGLDVVNMYADQQNIYLNFNSYSKDNEAKVELYNVVGQLMMPSTKVQTVGMVNIAMNEALAPGMYIVVLDLGNGNTIDKKVMVSGK